MTTYWVTIMMVGWCLASAQTTTNRFFELRFTSIDSERSSDTLYISADPGPAGVITSGKRFQVLPVTGEPIVVSWEAPQPLRLTISAANVTPPYIFENLLLEATDRLACEIAHQRNRSVIINVTGRGQSKYNAMQRLQQARARLDRMEGQLNVGKQTIGGLLEACDKERNECLSSWKAHDDLSESAFEIIQADMNAAFNRIKLRLWSNAFTKAQGNERSAIVEEIKRLATEPPTSLRDTDVPWTSDYISLAYEKQKWLYLWSENPNYKPFEFTSYYRHGSWLKLLEAVVKAYNNPIKESIIANHLLNLLEIKMFFGGCQPTEFSKGLTKAASEVTDANIKAWINNKAKQWKTGAPIFPFRLPSSAGDMIGPENFRGDLAIVTVWINGCTACLDLRNELITNILPIMKDKPDIKIISIGRMPDQKSWLQALHRNSRPEFINLWLDEQANKDFVDFYTMTYAPFILLIDRKGQLISFTVRDIQTIKNLILASH